MWGDMHTNTHTQKQTEEAFKTKHKIPVNTRQGDMIFFFSQTVGTED